MSAMRGLGFLPDDKGRHVDELRQRMANVKRAHVSWGPKADTLTPDERARMLLDLQWRIDRGHSVRMTHIDSACRWWHLPCFARRSLAKFRRWRDISLLRLDPYQQRTKV